MSVHASAKATWLVGYQPRTTPRTAKTAKYVHRGRSGLNAATLIGVIRGLLLPFLTSVMDDAPPKADAAAASAPAAAAASSASTARTRRTLTWKTPAAFTFGRRGVHRQRTHWSAGAAMGGRFARAGGAAARRARDCAN